MLRLVRYAYHQYNSYKEKPRSITILAIFPGKLILKKDIEGC